MYFKVEQSAWVGLCNKLNNMHGMTVIGVVAGLVWSYDPESYAGSSVCYW